MKITIEIEGVVFEAVLTNEFSPKTMEKIVNSLPIESEAKTWGDELYFDVPVEMEEENARGSVSKGGIGYWPAGKTLCIFYGKTPLSESEEKIVPASPVNIVGKIEDPDRLKRIRPKGGEKIRIAEWQ
ncbi:MAG: cyclophilin-like fold protein [archaeon]|nr:cyclophilin-like fold protein [archaeon]